MYEVEVKVPASLDRVRDRLHELDARPLGAVVQEDTYYDAPHRTFSETDEALRVRIERPTEDRDSTTTDEMATGAESDACITYKGPLVDDDSKTREEVETGVDRADDADAIFRHLGFEPAATVRKERERYAVDGYTVTLDAVDDVGEYVEVETEVTDDGIEAARSGAFDVLDRLGLDPDDQIRTSYLGLLLSEASE